MLTIQSALQPYPFARKQRQFQQNMPVQPDSVASGKAADPVLSKPVLASQVPGLGQVRKAPLFGSISQSPYFHTGDRILGQHPPDDKELNKLDEWRRKIWEEAKKPRPGLPKGWLDPFDTHFVVVDLVDLIKAAARGGFLTRYPHWQHGQEFHNLYEPQRHHLSKIYELVINNDPGYAFLLDTNEEYEQAVVMAHVFAHTDFFKNNHLFKSSNRQMVQRMGDHKRLIEKHIANPRIGYENVEKFLDKAHSIQWLIDLGKTAPPSLYENRKVAPEKIVEEVEELKRGIPGMKVGDVSLPEWMEESIYPQKQQEMDREVQWQRKREALKKIPPHPERDLLGFLIKHGDGMEDWQRQILTLMRDESYYFAPQLKTKIMNEGWATFWHSKLMSDVPSLINPKRVVAVSSMMAGVVRSQRTNINPYLLGYVIFKDICERWSKGQHDSNPEYRKLQGLMERRSYNNHAGEAAGIQKIQEIRSIESDFDFIRKYFTEEIAQRLQMYNYDTEENVDDTTTKVISSKDFQDIKQRLLDQLENGGQPIIEVIDGNLNQRKELLLRHLYKYSLKPDYAETTLAYIQSMWGHTVHLDTMVPNPMLEKLIPIRVTAEPVMEQQPDGTVKKGCTFKAFHLDEHGNPTREFKKNDR